MTRSVPVRIFFFGDSICFGQGVSPHNTWVARIAARVTKERAPVQFVFQNPSINGNTTRMALERIAYDVQSHQPDILLVQFGMNDCNVWESDRGYPRVSEAAFAANLSEIIDRGRLFGAKIITLGTNHTTTRTSGYLPNTDYTYESSNQKYNSVIRKVACETGAILADAEAAFRMAIKQGRYKHDDLLLQDGLHLSDAGHALYFEHRLPIVLSAVDEVLALCPR